MTTRLVKPDTGALVRLSQKAAQAGDGVVVPALGGFASLVATGFGVIGGLASGEELLFLFLAIPFTYLTGMVAYLRGTKEISSRDMLWYERIANSHMPKIKGHSNEKLAAPMMEQVYKCTIEKHPTTQWGKNCALCSEREQLIKQLIPNAPSDRSDIEATKRFLEMKKEADDLHDAALKELTA